MSDELEGGDFSVVEGVDGRLFLDTYDGTDVMRLYTEPDALPSSVYETWRDALARRRDYFGQRGITYLTLVVPDGCAVYPDKLPAGITLTPKTPYRRIEDMLDDETLAQCLYVLDDLVAGRGEHDTFQTTDSHWTDFGAYLAYRRAMATLAAVRPDIEVLPSNRIEWSERLSYGALGAMMPQERSERLRIARVLGSECRPTHAVATEVRDGYMVVVQDRPDLPTAVVFRDSFMTNAHKFFSESFRRTVYVSHPNRLFFDLIEAENPDVVIFEIVERRLCIPPREPSMFDFRMMFGDLLLDDPNAVVAQVASRSLLRNADIQGALAANDEVLTLVSPNARLLVHRSRLLTQLGKPHAALEALRAAVTLDPHDAPIRHFLSQALRQRGLFGEAAVASRQATEIEPRQAAFWSVAITAALETGDVEGARTLAKQALEHHPDEASVHYMNSRALVAAGELEAAETSARKAVDVEPDTALYLRQLVSVLIRARNWAEANYSLTRLRTLDPETPGLDEYVDLVEQNLADQPGDDLIQGTSHDDPRAPVRSRDTAP
jgi:tetratricopeptide (TPR) repeat protein